jgi:hypothetical protein
MLQENEAPPALPSAFSNLPRYWDHLCAEDQTKYLRLQSDFAEPEYSNRRGRSKAQFDFMLQRVKSFVVRGDANDINRGLVCGTIWLTRGMAVNIQQMKFLTSKCKSSINGSFGMLGYGTIAAGADSAGELLAKLPFLKSNFSELRQWTIRQLVTEQQSETPAPPEPVQAPSVDLDLSGIPPPDLDMPNPFGMFFDLDQELAKGLAEDLPSGAYLYETPPPALEDVVGARIDFQSSGLARPPRDDGFSFDFFDF